MLGRVRELHRACHAGGIESLEAFRELATLLLTMTVVPQGEFLRLIRAEDRKDRAVLAGTGGPTDPIALSDGRYLRVSVSLFIDWDGENDYLKVAQSSFQYQSDRAGEAWIVRYDYLREPGDDPHPTAHLQVNGTGSHHDIYEGLPLPRLHFPTGRVAFEAVIRMLIEQYRVEPNQPREVWMPVLHESEHAFLDVAHRPQSGPSRPPAG